MAKIINFVEGLFFEKPKCKKGSPTQQHREVGKRQRTKKTLSPSGQNNESHVHKISKWVLRKQMGSKKLGKREIVSNKPMGSV